MDTVRATGEGLVVLDTDREDVQYLLRRVESLERANELGQAELERVRGKGMDRYRAAWFKLEEKNRVLLAALKTIKELYNKDLWTNHRAMIQAAISKATE